MNENAPQSLFATWIATAIAFLALLAKHLIDWGSMRNRQDAIEERLDKVEADLKEKLDDIKQTLHQQHERIRNDLNDQSQIMLGLVEERGRNDARHDENQRALDLIARRMEKFAP